LGITDLFEATFDIIDANYVPKPDAAPYLQFTEQFGIVASRAAFFEDITHNLKVPHELGMSTVLVSDPTHDTAKHLNGDAEAHYVHFKTHDLAVFLRRAATGQAT
jgi:putative hydrolase of the HAD superfamily